MASALPHPLEAHLLDIKFLDIELSAVTIPPGPLRVKRVDVKFLDIEIDLRADSRDG
jgi:hypothetical protein